MDVIECTPYQHGDGQRIRALLGAVGWSSRQIEGQVRAVESLAAPQSWRRHRAGGATELAAPQSWRCHRAGGATELAAQSSGFATMARQGSEVLGYIACQFYEWNRLGQIPGLAVDPQFRQQKIATRLVGEAERRLQGSATFAWWRRREYKNTLALGSYHPTRPGSGLWGKIGR